MIDLDALEALAEAATPGEWRVADARTGADEGEVLVGIGLIVAPAHPGREWTSGAQAEVDSRFVAHASPDVVRELVERVLRAEAAMHEIGDTVPMRGDKGGDCAFCGGIKAVDDLDLHMDDCPWKIARRAVEAGR